MIDDMFCIVALAVVVGVLCFVTGIDVGQWIGKKERGMK